MNDDELQKHFDALRELDQAKAPHLRVLIARRPKRGVTVWALASGAGLTLTGAALAFVVVMPQADRPPQHEFVVPVEISDAEPLAFLLEPIPDLEVTP
jgi:hypothetical protein